MNLDTASLWFKTELNAPFNLQNLIDHKKVKYLTGSDELAEHDLPWRNPESKQYGASCYAVYLDIFDLNKTPSTATSGQQLSASLCLSLDSKGQIAAGKTRLSSFLWAQQRQTRPVKEQAEVFPKDYQHLISQIEAFDHVLTLASLQKITDLVQQWHGYTAYTPDFCVAVAMQNHQRDEVFSCVGDIRLIEPEVEMKLAPPLNSDVLLPLAELLNDELQPALLTHLLTPQLQHKLDLRSEDGMSYVVHKASPECANQGRWPRAAHLLTDQMQQFNINQLKGELRDGGLYGVNTPQGCDVSPVVLDTLADAVVGRAKVLAGLTESTDAFKHTRQQVCLTNGLAQSGVGELIDALKGFEVVLTAEKQQVINQWLATLNLTTNLGGEYRAQAFLPQLSEAMCSDEARWGCIGLDIGQDAHSLAELLLRQANASEVNHLAADNRPNFATAQHNFKKVSAELTHQLEKLEEFKFLSQVIELTEKGFCRQEQDTFSGLDLKFSDLTLEIVTAKSDYELLGSKIDQLEVETREVELKRPGVWASLTKAEAREYEAQARPLLKKHRMKLTRYRLEVVQLAKKLKHLEADYAELAAQRTEAASLLKQKQQEYRACRRVYLSLAPEFSEMSIPNVHIRNELESRSNQVKAYWQSTKLNHLKTQVFIKALELQQAWVLEVYRPGGEYASNLIAMAAMLSGKLEDEKRFTCVWQNLFMLTPVICMDSSARSRYLSHIGPQAQGWSFILDAHQVLPQSHVLTLARSRRCVSVGDASMSVGFGGFESSQAPDEISLHQSIQSSSQFGVWLKGAWYSSPLRVHLGCNDPMYSALNKMGYEDLLIHGSVDKIEKSIGPLGVSQSICHSKHHAITRTLVEAIYRLIAKEGGLPKLSIFVSSGEEKTLLQTLLCESLFEVLHESALSYSQAEILLWCKFSIQPIGEVSGGEGEVLFFIPSLSDALPEHWINKLCMPGVKHLYVLLETEAKRYPHLLPLLEYLPQTEAAELYEEIRLRA